MRVALEAVLLDGAGEAPARARQGDQAGRELHPLPGDQPRPEDGGAAQRGPAAGEVARAGAGPAGQQVDDDERQQEQRQQDVEGEAADAPVERQRDVGQPDRRPEQPRQQRGQEDDEEQGRRQGPDAAPPAREGAADDAPLPGQHHQQREAAQAVQPEDPAAIGRADEERTEARRPLKQGGAPGW